MPRWIVFAVLTVLPLGCGNRPVPEQAAPGVSVPARDEALRGALLQRVRDDQAARQQLIDAFQAGREPDSLLIARMLAVDTENTAWLKTVVGAHGWPGRSLVGADGANAAFLLVQHADQDTALQTAVLPLLERAYRAGDATGQQVALLTDRVAKARGQPQVYGTQANIVGGRVVLAPIADSVHVDARRASVGLMPLRDYVRALDSLYTARRKP
jgi:hypothetical protein